MLVLLIPFALLATLFAQPYFDRFARCRGHTQFDGREWNDSALVNGRTAARECMVDDLLERDGLIGKTRAEVVALLASRQKRITSMNTIWFIGLGRNAVGCR